MKKNKDFFKKAVKEIQREQPKSVIGTYKFIDWICSKSPILEGDNKITPIEEYERKGLI